MPEPTTLKIFVHANSDLTGALIDGSGLAARINAIDGVSADVVHEPASGFGALRASLDEGSAAMLQSGADIVILSIADDVRALPDLGASAEEAVHAVRADLVAVTQLIKEKVGAHILVANQSTVDPGTDTFNYQNITPEPMSLRIQRLDLMLIGVSNEEGISIIDIDRKVAELGAGGNVTAAMEYSDAANAIIADETVRVLEDYGFFDDRPLLAQVGAKGAKK